MKEYRVCPSWMHALGCRDRRGGDAVGIPFCNATYGSSRASRRCPHVGQTSKSVSSIFRHTIHQPSSAQLLALAISNESTDEDGRGVCCPGVATVSVLVKGPAFFCATISTVIRQLKPVHCPSPFNGSLQRRQILAAFIWTPWLGGHDQSRGRNEDANYTLNKTASQASLVISIRLNPESRGRRLRCLSGNQGIWV